MSWYSSTSGWPGILHIFGIQLYNFTQVHIMSRAVQGIYMINNLISRFRFNRTFQGFNGLVLQFWFSQWGCVVYCTEMITFFIRGDASPLSWNIFLAVLSCLHTYTISFRLFAAESNPWKIYVSATCDLLFLCWLILGTSRAKESAWDNL